MIEYQFLKYLLQDKIYLEQVLRNKINSSYFIEQGSQELFNLIIDYYSNYKVPITREVLIELVNSFSNDKKILIMSSFELVINTSLEETEFKLVLDLLKDKYKDKVLAQVLNSCSSFYSSNNYDECVRTLQKGIATLQRLEADEIREGDLKESADLRWSTYLDRKAGKFNKVVYTGFPTIDKCSYGAEGGELWVIMGFSKAGKSTLLFDIGVNIWNSGGNVLYVSAELSKEELERKVGGVLAGVPIGLIRMGRLEPEQEEKFKQSLDYQKSKENIFYTLDAPGCSTLIVRAKIDELLKTHQLDAILVDYIDLLTPVEKSNSRWEKASNVTLELRRIARDYSIPVFTIAQLSREGKKTGSVEMEYVASSVDIIRHADLIIGLKPLNAIDGSVSNIIEIEGKIIGSRKGPVSPPFKLEANFGFGLIREVV